MNHSLLTLSLFPRKRKSPAWTPSTRACISRRTRSKPVLHTIPHRSTQPCIFGRSFHRHQGFSIRVHHHQLRQFLSNVDFGASMPSNAQRIVRRNVGIVYTALCCNLPVGFARCNRCVRFHRLRCAGNIIRFRRSRCPSKSFTTKPILNLALLHSGTHAARMAALAFTVRAFRVS